MLEVITDAQTGEVTVRELTPYEVAALQPKASDVRAQRRRLLADCDWTQLPDAKCDQTAWAAYRQALRDIPQQSGFPTAVVWPTIPE